MLREIEAAQYAARGQRLEHAARPGFERDDGFVERGPSNALHALHARQRVDEHAIVLRMTRGDALAAPAGPSSVM